MGVKVSITDGAAVLNRRKTTANHNECSSDIAL